MFRKRARFDPAADLRALLLAADPVDLGLPPDGSRQVWGVLVDLPQPGGADTLVALTDGTASLYDGAGGGLLAGGDHEAVVVAAEALVLAVETALDVFEPTDDRRLPAPHFVRFWALAYGGVRLAEASDLDLEDHDHPLARINADAQVVLTELATGQAPG